MDSGDALLSAAALVDACASDAAAVLAEQLMLSARERAMLEGDTNLQRSQRALRSAVSTSTHAASAAAASASAADASLPMSESQEHASARLRDVFHVVNAATFVAELALTDDDEVARMSPGTVLARAAAIARLLRSVERAALRIAEAQNRVAEAKLGAVLGIELAELLYFRVRVLVHMTLTRALTRASVCACACAQEASATHTLLNAARVVEALWSEASLSHAGIAWACTRFQSFRSVRRLCASIDKRAAERVEVSSSASHADVARLLELDAYSDSHVLSLAYELELCVEAWKRFGDEELRSEGLRLVRVYLEVVALLPQGAWDVTRVEAMRAQLESS